jgi:hypothetical protein
VKNWLSLVRGGDWLVVLAAIAAVAVSFPLMWRGGPAERVVIRLDGRIVAEYPLNATRTVEIAGPLGTTVVEIQPGRARVLADPGPRQYCVRQGWLVRANAVAICAPNHVSVGLAGGQPGYDSLTF